MAIILVKKDDEFHKKVFCIYGNSVHKILFQYTVLLISYLRHQKIILKHESLILFYFCQTYNAQKSILKKMLSYFYFCCQQHVKYPSYHLSSFYLSFSTCFHFEPNVFSVKLFEYYKNHFTIEKVFFFNFTSCCYDTFLRI